MLVLFCIKRVIFPALNQFLVKNSGLVTSAAQYNRNDMVALTSPSFLLVFTEEGEGKLHGGSSVFNLHVSVVLSAVEYISPGKSSRVSLRVLISRWLLVLLILLLAQPRKQPEFMVSLSACLVDWFVCSLCFRMHRKGLLSKSVEANLRITVKVP